MKLKSLNQYGVFVVAYAATLTAMSDELEWQYLMCRQLSHQEKYVNKLVSFCQNHYK